VFGSKVESDFEPAQMNKRLRGEFEYEQDRQARAIAIYIWRKFRRASFGELATFVTNCVLILLATIAALIYGGQLGEMRHTNELTKQALDASKTANALNTARIKEDQAAFIVLQPPQVVKDPDASTYQMTAQFSNSGKVNANNFDYSVVLYKKRLPDFTDMAKPRLVHQYREHFPPGGTTSRFGRAAVAYANFDLGNFSDSDMQDIKDFKWTFQIEASYSYENGFGDSNQEKQCIVYSVLEHRTDWDDCNEGHETLRRLTKNKKVSLGTAPQ